MKDIVVKGSSALENIISQLTSYNKEFEGKVQELCAEQKKLSGMWKGESNDAFNQVFAEDKVQFTVFHDNINDYVNKLRTIKENYENTEANNVAIARTRGKS
ncbi:MAG: WXG100 family type VII secretion target [Lachnospiraceae bacterium]|nr:WXG100 family type VII secretion target [Lachnospiraceae bacterium]